MPSDALLNGCYACHTQINTTAHDRVAVLSDSSQNVIAATDSTVILTNVDNTISGASQLGDGLMMLVNDGTIDATGTNALVIDTGANTVDNSGTLEATGSGGLFINSDVSNSGLLWADGGNLTVNGSVTGTGSAEISGQATLEFGNVVYEDILFDANSTGTLKLDQSVLLAARFQASQRMRIWIWVISSSQRTRP